MRHILLAMMAAAVASGATAQVQVSALTPDQKGYIAYHQCMMQAAMRASHTTARDEDIFGIARQACAATRAAVTAGQQDNREYLAALDAADAEKAGHFPTWIKGVRERRAAFGACTRTAAPQRP